MFKEDNNGFVFFPHPNNKLVVGKNVGKTLVYLVAFEFKGEDNNLSNINLKLPGLFCSDDMSVRPDFKLDSSIDELVQEQELNDQYDRFYFPNINSEDELKRLESIDLISCICIGWDNFTYEYSRQHKFWNATFRDLTNEGSRLYYSLKKLHNNKEVRLLTFNHI